MSADADHHQIFGINRTMTVDGVIRLLRLARSRSARRFSCVSSSASISGVRRRIHTGLPRHSTVIIEPTASLLTSASTGAPAARAVGRGQAGNERHGRCGGSHQANTGNGDEKSAAILVRIGHVLHLRAIRYGARVHQRPRRSSRSLRFGRHTRRGAASSQRADSSNGRPSNTGISRTPSIHPMAASSALQAFGSDGPQQTTRPSTPLPSSQPQTTPSAPCATECPSFLPHRNTQHGIFRLG